MAVTGLPEIIGLAADAPPPVMGVTGVLNSGFAGSILGLASPEGAVASAVAVPESLDPASAPHAASPNATRTHSTAERNCVRATEAKLFMKHHPGQTLKRSPGQRNFTRAHDSRSPIAIGMTAT